MAITSSACAQSDVARHALFKNEQYKSFLFGLTEYRNRSRKGVIAHLGEKLCEFQLIRSKILAVNVFFFFSKLKVYIVQK